MLAKPGTLSRVAAALGSCLMERWLCKVRIKQQSCEKNIRYVVRSPLSWGGLLKLTQAVWRPVEHVRTSKMMCFEALGPIPRQ